MVVSGSPDLAAQLVLQGFEEFNAGFQHITRRAQRRFEQRDWRGARADAVERLELYEVALDRVTSGLDTALGECARKDALWTEAKARFASLITDRFDIDRAETFFNSITRRMLKTVGINRSVEFFHLHPRPMPDPPNGAVFRTYVPARDTRSSVAAILTDLGLNVPFENLGRDAALVAQEIDLCIWPLAGTTGAFTIDVVRAVFYRNKMAYVVGRILAGGTVIPIIIPLVNTDGVIVVDAVLLRGAEASIVFSFAYSYFFVDVERHDALIGFLRTILPRSDLAELYNALGYSRHGKTEFYRDLHRFVHVSREQFVIAPGLEGAVMIAFTLPNYDFVFKVIKDRPCFLRTSHETPKEITEEKVRERYRFVSRRDRAGRMVDTQEFENLRFKRKRFSEQLLLEFTGAATRNVSVGNEYVIIHRVYVQKKVVPLPTYFGGEKDPEAIRRVLVDFGYFLKDIAASGVFPCDLFNTWNYGVTHWGRVVLYDYDDVVPIESIRFRDKPRPRDEREEMEPEEDWIVATGEDFFMDEIDRFSGVPKPLKGVFRSVHGDLYTLRFWTTLVDRLNRGEIFDVIPYDRAKRFQAWAAAARGHGVEPTGL